jgi:hypothetical protein
MREVHLKQVIAASKIIQTLTKASSWVSSK